MRRLVERKIDACLDMEVEKRLESIAVGGEILHDPYVSIRRAVDNSGLRRTQGILPLAIATMWVPLALILRSELARVSRSRTLSGHEGVSSALWTLLRDAA
jgi:hypothetical protein